MRCMTQRSETALYHGFINQLFILNLHTRREAVATHTVEQIASILFNLPWHFHRMRRAATLECSRSTAPLWLRARSIFKITPNLNTERSQHRVNFKLQHSACYKVLIHVVNNGTFYGNYSLEKMNLIEH